MKLLSIFSAFLILCCVSCDKGYEARFTNYYTETIDSVTVGLSGAKFSNISVQKTTDYQPVKRGDHSIVFKTKSGLVFYGLLKVPSSGTGKYTIQVDGVRLVSVLED